MHKPLPAHRAGPRHLKPSQAAKGLPRAVRSRAVLLAVHPSGRGLVAARRRPQRVALRGLPARVHPRAQPLTRPACDAARAAAVYAGLLSIRLPVVRRAGWRGGASCRILVESLIGDKVLERLRAAEGCWPYARPTAQQTCRPPLLYLWRTTRPTRALSRPS
jgi:hypothetical protein